MKTAGLEVTLALRALLDGSVDYAGLFPLAALALEPALNNYAAHLCREERWMLGCFVLLAAKMAEAGPLPAERFDADGFQWRGRPVATAALEKVRPFITSFGSCSFDEPRDDLRAAGLLP